jgi:hypothetical protein
MQVFQYSRVEAESGQCPFQGVFASNPWVGFHGTSNQAADAIEQSGFEWQKAVYSLDEVEQLLCIFDALHWNGSVEGRGVLATFTQSDFASGPSHGRKPVYFAESSYRGLRYSHPDWSGGETALAIRHTFSDLDSYLNEPTVRSQATHDAFGSLSDMIGGAIPPELRPVDAAAPNSEEVGKLRQFLKDRGIRVGLIGRTGVDDPAVPSETWVRSQLADLGALRARVKAIRDTFVHGVIYAVRFCEGDVPFMSYSSAGLSTRRAIPRDRVLAKAVVQPEAHQFYRTRRAANGLDPHTAAVLSARECDGIVSRVRATTA